MVALRVGPPTATHARTDRGLERAIAGCVGQGRHGAEAAGRATRRIRARIFLGISHLSLNLSCGAPGPKLCRCAMARTVL